MRVTDVWVLPPFALEEDALDGYVEKLKTVIGHAGVLEQLLCRISFFLPDDVVQTVVAIVSCLLRSLSFFSDKIVVVHARLLQRIINYL